MAKAPANVTEESALRRLFAQFATQEAQADDPETIAFQIAEQYMTAEDVDDILSESTLVKAEELVGIPFFLDSYELRRSDMNEGAGVYAILSVRKTHAPDEILKVSCGSTNVLAQVIRLDQLDALPQVVTIKRTDTRTGFRVMRLVRAQQETMF